MLLMRNKWMDSEIVPKIWDFY